MTKDGDTVAVWFSCGAASAVALQKTILRYPKCKIRVLNNPVREEPDDNRRFLNDIANWLKVDIELVINPKYPHCSAVKIWEKVRAMAFPKGAPCTTRLKREARQYWEKTNHFDWLVMGFTAEESRRANNFKMTERTNLLTPLIDLKINKKRCFEIIQKAGIRLPISYYNGLPNANCIGCPKATSPNYWSAVKKNYPDIFQQRLELSERLDVKLLEVREERLSLTMLDKIQYRRLEMGISQDEQLSFDCGLFCEEDF